MREEHKFNSPRNLFEKLVRESEKLDITLDGDNLFNFICTACALKEWMKKSPDFSAEVVKRFLKRVSKDETLTMCKDLLTGKHEFSIIIDGTNGVYQLVVDEIIYDPYKVKNDILDLFSVHFKVKGS